MSIIVNVFLFLLACGAVSSLIAMFYLISRGEKRLNLRQLPPLETRPLLNKKENSLNDDLNGVCEKLGLRAFAKVSMGELLQTREEFNRDKWRELLTPYEVDFAVCDPRTSQLVLVILPTEHGSTLKPKHDFIMKTLNKMYIPHIQLGNYNRAGLEKAIKDRLEGNPSLGSAPPLPAAAAATTPTEEGGVEEEVNLKPTSAQLQQMAAVAAAGPPVTDS